MTHGPDGSVLDVGRRSRTVSTPLRRALDTRDGGCRFPGCRGRHATPHHIRHRADGGETSLENLVLLRAFHHRALHEGGWRMEVTEEGAAGERREVRFLRPDGRPLPPSPALPPAPPDPVEALQRNGAADSLDVDGWTATPRWNGERLDLHRAIHALWRPRATEGISRA